MASQEQRDMAVSLLNSDYCVGRRISPPGPSIAEMEAIDAKLSA